MEGNSGSSAANFNITLSLVSALPVSVTFTTNNNTAIAGEDFVAQTGIATFAPGQTSLTVSVQVTGDTFGENDEYFFMDLSNAVNASLAVPQATGTIVNDDSAPLQLLVNCRFPFCFPA